VFLLIGLSGLGNVFLLLYRFFVLGFLSHAPEAYSGRGVQSHHLRARLRRFRRSQFKESG
jgi:hypothetical protein